MLLTTSSPSEVQVTDGGEVIEDWVVTPLYEYNDEIMACKGFKGGTGVLYAGDWFDLNENARAWVMRCL